MSDRAHLETLENGTRAEVDLLVKNAKHLSEPVQDAVITKNSGVSIVILAQRSDVTTAVQWRILQDGANDQRTLSAVISLVQNPHTSPDVLQAIGTRRWEVMNGIDIHEELLGMLLTRPKARLDEDTHPRVLQTLVPDLYARITRDCDQETLRALEGTWRGSTRELVQAAGLVSR